MGTVLSWCQCHRVSCLDVTQRVKSIDDSFSYMVDAADHEKLDAAKQELSSLLEKPQLHGIPVLVLGNKRDVPNALEVQELIERL